MHSILGIVVIFRGKVIHTIFMISLSEQSKNGDDTHHERQDVLRCVRGSKVGGNIPRDDGDDGNDADAHAHDDADGDAHSDKDVDAHNDDTDDGIPRDDDDDVVHSDVQILKLQHFNNYRIHILH